MLIVRGGVQLYGTIQVKLAVPDAVKAYLVHQCQQANSLINQTIYTIKQAHFADCPRKTFFDEDGLFRTAFKLRAVKASSPELCKQMKENAHYRILGGQCAQQALKGVAESFTSFNQLLKRFFRGEGTRPRMPRYRKKGGLAPITFPAQPLKFDPETGACRLTISLENKQFVKDEFGLSEIWLNGCHGIRSEQIVEVRILPRNGCFYVEYVYKGQDYQSDVDPTNALGIDPGLNNWLTCVSTVGKSFLLDGRKLKSINQWYNKQVAKLKDGQPQGFWSDELATITEKRNRQVRDAVNKAARFVINYCLSHKLGIVVFGWNQRNKDSIAIGKRNNQNFVQVPTARLKNRIAQLCEQYGIQFVETEESYTSKCSFLDRDVIPVFGGEKPASWIPSGRRVQRGLYKAGDGVRLNADCNSAANILRKVASRLGISLVEIGRESLTAPKRYDLFRSLKISYRERCVARLQPA